MLQFTTKQLGTVKAMCALFRTAFIVRIVCISVCSLHISLIWFSNLCCL